MSSSGLFLKQSQGVTLTPQLQQSIRLLQLSGLELEEEIAKMLEDNPFLELEAQESEVEAHQLNELGSTDGALDDTEYSATEFLAEELPEAEINLETQTHLDDLDINPDGEVWDYVGSAPQQDDDEDWQSQHKNHQPTLREHLLAQLRECNLDERMYGLVAYLIESLDVNGWLSDSIDVLQSQLPSELNFLTKEIEDALCVLQQFDPSGVGACDWRHCLILQLEHLKPEPAVATAIEMVKHHIEWVASKNYLQLKQYYRLSDGELKQVFKVILSLNPKPGLCFQDSQIHYVAPDVIVKRRGQKLEVQVNSSKSSKLQTSFSANLLEGSKISPILKEKVKEAKWFIRCVEQRAVTLVLVAQAIVNRQKQFFIHGSIALRPLTLREIADEIGLHDSTVSRVTTNKYMLTPLGLYELKYFFSSTIETEAGGVVSGEAIRTLILQMIKEENPKKPISDQVIATALEKHGYSVARRTVAKYREMMGIAPKSMRKSI